MLHILFSFLLLEVYLSTSQKRPLILELLNLSVWIFPYTQCHTTSFPYLDLTMWLKFLEYFVSLIFSCFLDLGLIHQSWRRGSDLFFSQAQAVNTNHVWSWQRHDRKCRTKRRTSKRVKPSEKWQSRLWERTGSYTPNSWVFIFSQMESRRPKRRRPYF